MKTLRIIAAAILVLVAAAALGAGYLAPSGYEHQFREAPAAPATKRPRNSPA